MGRVKALLIKDFEAAPLSADEAAMLDEYEQWEAELEHATDLEYFDYWEVKAKHGEVKGCQFPPPPMPNTTNLTGE
jgi:hypothetical protein